MIKRIMVPDYRQTFVARSEEVKCCHLAADSMFSPQAHQCGTLLYSFIIRGQSLTRDIWRANCGYIVGNYGMCV